MKIVFVLMAAMFLNGCFYPATRTQIDPITQAPTGQTETPVSGGVYTGLLVGGAAATKAQMEKNKKPKKQPAFPKPPEEVLKPMVEK